MRRRRHPQAPARLRQLALLYVRVSTAEQADDRASLSAQQATLEAFARIHNWDTGLLIDAGASAKNLSRPGMTTALAMLGAGEADVLAAVRRRVPPHPALTRLDRISRSVYDVAGLMQRSIDEGWALVTVHGSIDTSTAMGRAFVHMAPLFAELERGMIGERTKAGMAQKRLEGVHLGRRTSLAVPVIECIRVERAVGRSYAAIASRLNADRIPTATGNPIWGVSSVQSALTVNPSPRPSRARPILENSSGPAPQ